MVDYGHLARQVAIGFGIALIFPLLVYYGVCSLHPPPVWRNYSQPTVSVSGIPTPAERQADREKRQESGEAYASAAKGFAKFLLLVAAPLGVAAIAIGANLRSPATSSGLIVGGIITVGVGYWAYWENLQGWLRFVSLLIAFTVLLIAAGRQSSKASPRHRGTPRHGGSHGIAPQGLRAPPHQIAHSERFEPHRSDGPYDPLPENEYRDAR